MEANIVTTEEKKKTKIFVATPMYGGMCFGYYTQSVLQLHNVFMQNNIDSLFSFMFNESLITRARNALVNAFLKTDCTHIFFIDSDIGFNPQSVLRMIEVDKEVIGGIYPKKEINWDGVKKAMDQGIPNTSLKYYTGSFVVNLVDYAGEVTVPVNEPCEIYNAGTGFLLIKREVFEKLDPIVPSYKNDVHDLGNTMAGQEVIKEFFATSIEPETERLLSEDYHFCYIWRKAGGKVYAAPWAQLTHNGTYSFEGRLTPSA
jgi:hypothetical protein